MADGFYVDFGALHDAAEGITDTLDAMATKKVSDIDAPRSAFGHDGLAGTVADFCDRWEIGVEHLTKDAEAVVGEQSDIAIVVEKNAPFLGLRLQQITTKEHGFVGPPEQAQNRR